MYVLPLIEIRGGESSHVLEGPGQGEARPLLDPVEVAHRFQGMGAQGFHVVDVDHAEDPKRTNDKTLLNLLQHTVLPVEAGGGVRSLKRIQELLDTGCQRVLVGTMGVLHPDWLREAALIFRDRLIACLDVQDDRVLVKARREAAPLDLDAAVAKIDGLGVGTVHLSYLGANGQGVGLAESLAKRLKTPLSYQGPIGSAAELERLARAGVAGVSLGREIYDGTLSFPELAKTYRVR